MLFPVYSHGLCICANILTQINDAAANRGKVPGAVDNRNRVSGAGKISETCHGRLACIPGTRVDHASVEFCIHGFILIIFESPPGEVRSYISAVNPAVEN